MYCPKCGNHNEDTALFCSKCGKQFMTTQNNVTTVSTGTSDSPYRTPRSAVTADATPYYSDQPIEYIGFWYRVLAYIIDTVISGIVFFIIAIIVGAIIGGFMGVSGANSNTITTVAGLIGRMISIIGGWLYFAFCESSTWQGTIGKKILGIKVVDFNGQRISFARATGRHFSKILSALILFVGFMMVGFTEKKQGLHDMIAGTYVVKT